MNKKQKHIALFFLSILSLVWSHQLLPHFEHIHTEAETTCQQHTHYNTSESSLSISTLFNYLFTHHCHFEIEQKDLLIAKIKTLKKFQQKIFIIQKIISDLTEIDFYSHSIFPQKNLQITPFCFKTFWHRGPPYFV